ncbi:MAG: CoA transferase subunit A [Thermomicrobiales bacterium]|nr:CoA transferase subunit A [Thermomicrobiales bacterium]
MSDRRTTLRAAIAAIPDGATVALGGNTLHRVPCAAVHEIVRQGKRGLQLVKTAGAYDVDLLCAAGCAEAVAAGFIGFETPFGMAPAYRRAVESGAVEAREHVCASVIAGLRAAIQGVPFMPLAGMTGSDLPAARGFRFVADPYGGPAVVAIPAITPDVAIVHVQETDAAGNARIVGSRFEDVLMAQAARRVIVTTERIVPRIDADLVAIPGFLIDAVVEAPGGAAPCSCAGEYDYDADALGDWIAAAKTADGARQWIDARLLAPAATR